MEGITFRALLAGPSGVGKSSFTTRLNQMRFCLKEGRVQVQVAEDAKEVKQEVRLQLLRREEDSTLSHIPNPPLPDIDAVIVMYSTDNLASFEAMEYYYQQTVIQLPNTIQVILGNKADSPNRLVATDRAMQFASDRNMVFGQISLKDSTNVVDVAESILNELLRKKRETERVALEEPRLILLEKPHPRRRRPYDDLAKFILIGAITAGAVGVLTLVSVGILIKHLITLCF